MADRNSAEIFGKVFEILAKDPTDDHKALARKIAKTMPQYDFNNGQMDADDALAALGLAKLNVPSEEYPGEFETVYWDETGFAKT